MHHRPGLMGVLGCRFRRWLSILLGFALHLVALLPVAGQSGFDDWSEPVVLTPDAGVVAFSPVAVADSTGYLHVVWTEAEGTGENRSFTSIYYASFDVRSWSMPIDIAVSAPGLAMSFLKGFVVTETGLLAVTWAEGQDIRMAVAPAASANSAQAWRVRRVANGVNPSLAATPDGSRWYLAYWSETTTLVVSVSEDEGLTWDAPQTVWAAEDGTAGSNVTALVGNDGALNLVWTEAAEARSWSGVAIWYGRLDPSTSEASVRQVSRSASLDEPTLDGPNITACPNGQLHIVWNNGVGSDTGRFHQWYDPDSGRWSQVAAVFPGLSGQTGKPGLVCDNTGRVHLLTSAQGGAAGGGLHYATWIDGTWSDYVTLWGGAYDGERPSMVILGGNELHLLWQVFDLDGQRVDSIAHTMRAVEALREEPRIAASIPVPSTIGPVTATFPGAVGDKDVPATPAVSQPAVPQAAARTVLHPLLIATGVTLGLVAISVPFARSRRR
ncbi:MAG: exo-alpha-sialidase [Anaerolineales bacterium]|nr:exo-alpha-sialidase [Anaerolineales bacterium]